MILRIAAGGLFLALGFLFIWLVMGPMGAALESTLVRLPVFSLLSLAGGAAFKTAWKKIAWTTALLAAPLFYAFAFRAAAFIPEVSTYPLSLGWSEASRYYYASLFFSERIYGAALPPSVLHPSRYLMQAAAFLLPDAPLWFHRLWQVCLWLVFSLAAGFLLVRRLNISEALHRLLVAAWAFLFLFQGPVYYHLLVMPVLLLWGFDRDRFWRTTALVLLASAWAGVSRINWAPVPGMLAASLYFMETSAGKQPTWRYLARPALWAFSGTAMGLAVQKAYEAFSGNPAWHFGTSFTSDLLWYRLLPSTTFPLGVLPAAVLVSLPLGMLLLYLIFKRRFPYHPLRLLGLGSILFVLFAGGVVVSVKIGGGSNLHNLDAYLLLLMVVAAYAWFGPFPVDKAEEQQYLPLAQPLIALAVIVPVGFALFSAGPLPKRDLQAAEAALEALKGEVGRAVDSGGEVLFISERHLLTFQTLDGVKLVPDYEKVFLMEMAMAGNAAYLETFSDDMAHRRFSLIVTEPLWDQYQGRYRPFGEENDAWVRGVVEPVLCSYQPSLTLPEVSVQLLKPLPGEAGCQ